MDVTTLKLLSICLIFLGESFGIYAEVVGAKSISQNNLFTKTFANFVVFVLISGALILSGYLVGIRAFKNIWLVSLTSILSILIVEPPLDYFVFKQFPTTGALIGFVFACIGFVATMLL
jgi:hypothetical protein